MTGIVLELQRDALERQGAASDLLRKALLVSRKLRVQEFEAWVRHELDGYRGDAGVPPYRKVVGEVKAWNPYQGWIPVIMPPEMTRRVSSRMVVQGVSELEELLGRDPPGALVIGFSPELAQEFLNGSDLEVPPYLHVGRNAIVKIVDAVRTTVLNWALDLEERGVVGHGLSFSPQERAAATSSSTPVVNYYGSVGQSQVMVASPNAGQTMGSTGSSGEARRPVEEIAQLLAEARFADVDKGEIEAELATL